jgi:hypothetical protein
MDVDQERELRDMLYQEREKSTGLIENYGYSQGENNI